MYSLAPVFFPTGNGKQHPGSRYSSCFAYDSRKNQLVLFGGGVYINGVFGYMNDLWIFPLSTQTWEWVSGNSTPFDDVLVNRMIAPLVNGYPVGYFNPRCAATEEMIYLTDGILSSICISSFFPAIVLISISKPYGFMDFQLDRL